MVQNSTQVMAVDVAAVPAKNVVADGFAEAANRLTSMVLVVGEMSAVAEMPMLGYRPYKRTACKMWNSLFAENMTARLDTYLLPTCNTR